MNSLGQNTGVGSLSFLQWTFPTQELSQGLLHCRWILHQLSYQGSPLHGCATNTLILWINMMWITLESYLTCTSTFNQPAHQSAPVSKHLQNPAPWPLLGPQHWHLLSLNRSLCFCPHSETKQDPVGLLCTKAFLCPPVFLFIANRLHSAFKTFSEF